MKEIVTTKRTYVICHVNTKQILIRDIGQASKWGDSRSALSPGHQMRHQLRVFTLFTRKV